MIEGYDIICFGPSDWWGMNPSCTTHIMQKLATKNKILYVNPFSSDLLGAVKKGFGRRVVRKLKSILRFLRRPQINLYVFSPIFFPFQGIKIIDAVNNFFLRLQIKIICLFLRMSKPILWVENIRVADILGWFTPLLVVYHVSDLFGEDEYTANPAALRQREERISQASDVLICVSKRLYEAKKAECDNVFYLPHGVDFQLFRKAANNGDDSIARLANVPRPIAGYYGTMTAFNDIELLRHCARNLQNVSFVLAGQITGGDYEELSREHNVYLPGRVPYEQIPALCASFNVCLLQWKMSKWIEYCNPLKFFEYMASGKPIVSVPIEEIAHDYSDIVSVASTKEEYCKAITWELNNDTNERAQRRIEAAKEHSWDNHVEQLSQIISEALETKTRQKTDLRPAHSGGVSK